MGRSNFFVIFFCTFIAFGGFLYDIGVISACLIMPDFVQRFGIPDGMGGYVLDAGRQSQITSLLSVGTFVGAFGQAFTADRLGRKYSVLLWSTIFTVGVTIQTATTYSLPQLLVGRVIAGLGVGALSALVPLYNGETAPKHLRGTLLVLYQAMIAGGLFLSYVIDLGSHSIPNSASWKIPVGLQMLWGLILVIGICFLPESPRHLLYCGKTTEARSVIAKFNTCGVNDELVDDVVAELELGLAAENEGGKATWSECFSPEVRLRTLHGMMIQFLQQLNGQNFYYYYGAVFFQSSGVELSPYAIQTLLGGVSFAMIFPAMYLIETTGRRKLLLNGAVLEAICALIAAIVGHTTLAPTGTPTSELTSRQAAGGKVLIAFAIMHVSAFSTFWGPAPWVYLGESFPMRVRSKCIALGAAHNWLWNFLLGFFAPKIAADIGPLILLIFFGMLIVAWFYVFFLIPETKGLSLEQVNELYTTGVKPWKSAAWEPTTGTTRKKPFEQTYYPSQLRSMEGSQQELAVADTSRIEEAKRRLAEKRGLRGDSEKLTKLDTPEHVEKSATNV